MPHVGAPVARRLPALRCGETRRSARRESRSHRHGDAEDANRVERMLPTGGRYYEAGSEKPIGLSGSARLRISWRIAPSGTISSLRLAVLRVRDERQEAVARLGRERREPQQCAVGELDLDHRLREPVLGGERLDPAVDPRDEVVERPGHPRCPELAHPRETLEAAELGGSGRA